MTTYRTRLDRIEAAFPPTRPMPMHRVIVDIGDTEQQATAVFAAERGLSVGEVGGNAIYRIVVEPRRHE